MDLQNQDLVKSLLEIFDRSCSLCHTNYDLKSHAPMMLCLSQHICCQVCANKRIETQAGGELDCPFCHAKIKKNQIMKVRRFDAIIELHENYETICKIKAEERYQKFKEELKYNLHNHNNERWLAELQEKEDQIASLYNFMLHQAKEFFKAKKVQRSIQILEQILMNYHDRNEHFIGLGSKDESEGYYGDVYKWFARTDSKKAVSALDLLGLCYLTQAKYPAQREFYTKLKTRFPADYRVWFGLAVVEHNSSNYKTAEELYLKVAQMKEKFDKPYQMMAFIEFQVNYNFEKGMMRAREALVRSPKNIFANYIMAMCLPTCQNEQRLIHLSVALDEDNLYLRAKLQMGILRLQSLNAPYKAKTCFEQCLQVNPEYHIARIHLAECFIAVDKRQEALQILNYFKGKSNSITTNLYYSIGKTFLKAGETKNAIEWLQKCNVDCYEQLASLYFEIEVYDKALEKYKLVKSFSRKEELKILLRMGECYEKLKIYGEALAVYQDALLMNPKEQHIMERIALITTIKSPSVPPRPRTGQNINRSSTVAKKNEKSVTYDKSVYTNNMKK